MPDDARINPHDTVASWVVSSHDAVSPPGHLPELQLKVPAGIFLNPTNTVDRPFGTNLAFHNFHIQSFR